MSKFRITMDLDFADLAPDLLQDGPAGLDKVEDAFRNMILSPSRAKSIQDLHTIRKDVNMDLDVKAIKMAEQILKIKATLIAESNLKAERLSPETVISTELPFERRYNEAA